jgi:DNA-binding transcriptional regulator LsrR (DeoR family)
MQTQTQSEALQTRVTTLETALSSAVKLLSSHGYSQSSMATQLGISRWQVRQLLDS